MARSVGITRKRIVEASAAVGLLLCVAAVVGGFSYWRERQKRLNRQLVAAMDRHFFETTKSEFRELRGIVQQGAEIDVTGSNGLTLLMLASEWNDLETVKFAIDRRSDVNVRTRDGCTALMFASTHGHPDIVQLLVGRGARPDLRDKEGGETALMWAAYQGHLPVVRLLLNHGADVNARSRNGETALLKAAYRVHMDVMRLLISRGADVNAADRVGSYSALNIIGSRPKGPGHPWSEAEVTEAARLLIDSGADLTLRDNWGHPALVRAKEQGHVGMARLLKRAATRERARR